MDDVNKLILDQKRQRKRNNTDIITDKSCLDYHGLIESIASIVVPSDCKLSFATGQILLLKTDTKATINFTIKWVQTKH